ncbi:MAG: PAS domain S-box protein [Dehalococcoidia bacterium]|nr:PAS domain S-box protein [Dehalococcoidia bacterium]
MSRDSTTLDDAGLARLIEQAPDAVIFAGTDGTIQAWNAAAERIFGHSAADALGQSLDLIIPENFREAHWTAYDRALGDRVTKYAGQSLATKSMRADGEQIYVELSFAIVLDDDGNSIGALAQARDITERFQQERKTRKHVAALEKELAEVKE